MLIFSAVAVFLTSLWDKGFIVSSNVAVFLKAAILVTATYYFIAPLCKLILLPLNILTLGLISLAVYSLIFFFLGHYFSLVDIRAWTFHGGTFLGLTLGKMAISQLANIFLSSLSISFIINLMEHIV